MRRSGSKDACQQREHGGGLLRHSCGRALLPLLHRATGRSAHALLSIVARNAPRHVSMWECVVPWASPAGGIRKSKAWYSPGGGKLDTALCYPSPEFTASAAYQSRGGSDLRGMDFGALRYTARGRLSSQRPSPQTCTSRCKTPSSPEPGTSSVLSERSPMPGPAKRGCRCESTRLAVRGPNTGAARRPLSRYLNSPTLPPPCALHRAHAKGGTIRLGHDTRPARDMTVLSAQVLPAAALSATFPLPEIACHQVSVHPKGPRPSRCSRTGPGSRS